MEITLYVFVYIITYWLLYQIHMLSNIADRFGSAQSKEEGLPLILTYENSK